MGRPWIVQEGYLLLKREENSHATQSSTGKSSCAAMKDSYCVLYLDRKLELFEDSTKQMCLKIVYVRAFSGWDGDALLKVDSYGFQIRCESHTKQGTKTVALYAAAYNRRDVELWCRALVAVLDRESEPGIQARRLKRKFYKEEKKRAELKQSEIQKSKEEQDRLYKDEEERLAAREIEIENMTPLERMNDFGALDDDTIRLLEKRRARLHQRQAPTRKRVNKAVYRRRLEHGVGGKAENVQPLQSAIVDLKIRPRFELPPPGQFFEGAGALRVYDRADNRDRGHVNYTGEDYLPRRSSASEGSFGQRSSSFDAFIPPPPPPLDMQSRISSRSLEEDRDDASEHSRPSFVPPPPPPQFLTPNYANGHISSDSEESIEPEQKATVLTPIHSHAPTPRIQEPKPPLQRIRDVQRKDLFDESSSDESDLVLHSTFDTESNVQRDKAQSPSVEPKSDDQAPIAFSAPSIFQANVTTVQIQSPDSIRVTHLSSKAVQELGQKSIAKHIFTFDFGERACTVERSYQELQSFHSRLSHTISRDALPKFPSKQFLRNELKTENMQKQGSKLLRYLQTLVRIAAIDLNPVFVSEFGKNASLIASAADVTELASRATRRSGRESLVRSSSQRTNLFHSSESSDGDNGLKEEEVAVERETELRKKEEKEGERKECLDSKRPPPPFATELKRGDLLLAIQKGTKLRAVGVTERVGGNAKEGEGVVREKREEGKGMTMHDAISSALAARKAIVEFDERSEEEESDDDWDD